MSEFPWSRPVMRILFELSSVPGPIGDSARRKLLRRARAKGRLDHGAPATRPDAGVVSVEQGVTVSDFPWTRPLSRLLYELSFLPGPIGASARRKMKRYAGRRSLADFDARVARLGPGDVCLDLGANLGVFTELLAATGAEVHAFEPDPHCFVQLQVRFAGWSNVHLHQNAVSDVAGTFLLRRTRYFHLLPDAQSQSSSIALKDAETYDDETAIPVETIAFADFVRGLGRPVALVKMDIEGAEFAILDHVLGMAAPLPIGAMFVETHERHMPERVALVQSIRRRNAEGTLPFPIDTFWP